MFNRFPVSQFASGVLVGAEHATYWEPENMHLLLMGILPLYYLGNKFLHQNNMEFYDGTFLLGFMVGYLTNKISPISLVADVLPERNYRI